MSYTPGDNFSATVSANVNWNVSKNQGALAPTANNSKVGKSQTYSKGTNAAQKADTVVSAVVSIAGGGSGSYFLSSGTPSFSDLLGQSGVIFARIKALQIRLLSSNEDSTNGGASSGITVGAGTHPFNGPLAGTAPTVTLNSLGASGPGDVFEWSTSSAAGWAVTNATNDQINITNNDGSNAAKVQITIVGASA